MSDDYAGYGIMVICIAVLNTVFSVRDFKYSKEVLERPVGIVKKYQPVGGTVGTLIYNIFFGGLIGIAGSIYAFVLRSFVMSNQNQFMQIEWEKNNHAGANPVNNQTFPNSTYYNVTAPPYMQPQPQSWGQQGNVQPSVPYNGSDTMLFAHACSKCGYTFNVKYKKREDQNKIPALMATCPRCKSKELIN